MSIYGFLMLSTPSWFLNRDVDAANTYLIQGLVVGPQGGSSQHGFYTISSVEREGTWPLGKGHPPKASPQNGTKGKWGLLSKIKCLFRNTHTYIQTLFSGLRFLFLPGPAARGSGRGRRTRTPAQRASADLASRIFSRVCPAM